ncbi:hypothetical protein K2173_008795 [Erythroxylum novogranatense]|uniref:Uncharacterized protein n=1 Tax=Erythroxylum novogranatense TaxID=1862640 RepID=A0AAV8T0D6_9ROSI|nr:hypothetical protein K2173_008795 [Erythroxylum novogranatense]
MESDLECQHRYHLNSGLTRYQSVPSSYFSSFLDGVDSGEDFMNRPHSPETQRIFSRLLANNSDYSSSHQNVYKMKKDSPPTLPVNQLVQSVQIMDDSRSRHNLYQNQLPEQNSKAGMDYGPATANQTGMRTRGFFSNMNIEFENGYAVLREASFPAASRGISTIAEVGNGETSLDTNDYGIGSWDDNNTFSDLHDSETQNLETANQPPTLAHHLSLTTSSAEMSAMEKVLQFQDSVPCKVRAKRGLEEQELVNG